MSTFGRTAVITVGRSVRLSADGCPEVKAGGITIDWSTVMAAPSDTTLEDSVPVTAGEKYLRYGQVVTKITLTAVDVVTVDATGGTFTLTVTTSAGAQTTGAIAFDASAATVQTAVRGLSNVGGTLATVTGSAGGPYTVTFDNSLGAVTLTAGSGSLTGNTHTASVVQTAPGGDLGKYGPYDPAATDGRATLTRGQAFLVNETVKQNDLHSDHPCGVLEGGMVFKSRIIQSGVATHTLAVGPTFAELNTAFPRLRYVEE